MKVEIPRRETFEEGDENFRIYLGGGQTPEDTISYLTARFPDWCIIKKHRLPIQKFIARRIKKFGLHLKK